jgi:hypothetical protein
MNPPKCDDLDYIHFLIAAQKVFTCTEAARCQPEGEKAPAHDAFTRLLSRKPPDTEALWQEAKVFVDLRKGLLILDDTTLDKPYARRMALVTHHWSGKHQRIVQGIALLTLIPCDFQVYDKRQGGKTNSRYAPESQGAGLCTGVSGVCAYSEDCGLLWLVFLDEAEKQSFGEFRRGRESADS